VSRENQTPQNETTITPVQYWSNVGPPIDIVVLLIF